MRGIQKVLALLLTLVLTAGALPVTVSAADTGFKDVPDDAYYADAVAWAVEEEITQGTGNGVFSPERTVTRAETVTFLWRAAGSPTPTGVSTGFSDVTDKNAFYYKAVLWAVEKGITNGVGGGRFNLTATLTYDQILTFLCMAGPPLPWLGPETAASPMDLHLPPNQTAPAPMWSTACGSSWEARRPRSSRC